MVFTALLACAPVSHAEESLDAATTRLEPAPQTLSIAAAVALVPLQEHLVAALATGDPALRIEPIVDRRSSAFRGLSAGSVDLLLTHSPMTPEEVEQVGADSFVEVPLVLDAVVVLAAESNAWLDRLTVEDLAAAWSGSARRWSDLHHGWPDEPITVHAYAGESLDALIGALPTSEDLQMHTEVGAPARSLENQPFAIALADLSGASRTELPVRVVPVDAGDGPVVPTEESLRRADYPLSRQLWLYARRQALESPVAADFVERLVTEAGELGRRLGYVPLPPAVQEQARSRLELRIAGSVFAAGMSGVAEVYGHSQRPEPR